MKHPVLTFLCCCLWSASAWGELPVRMEQTPSAWAGQTTEWDAPHVGFANNSYMSIEKVTFGPRATQVHAVLSANAGSRFSLSSQSKLVWDGGESRIIKVSKLKLDKEHAMPDSGKLHIVMSFPSPPSVPDRLHFVESEEDGGWRLCNIRPKASQPDGRTSSERSAGLPEHSRVVREERKANRTSSERGAGLPGHSRVVREERKATSPLSGRPITGSAWAPVAYTEDPDLPFSHFCDDSTAVSVKILNYTPLAGRELRFTYDKVDVGHVVYNEAYPIADDGTATVRLHPCFPISAFMSVGDGPQALVLLVPGNDISILMDMDEAADGLGIKGFKGAYAKLNYEVNVKGGKDLVSYDLSNAHLDSVMRADKPLHQSLSHYQDSVDSRIRHSGFVGATYQFLNIYNDYRYLQYYHTLRAYIYEKLIKAVKDMGAFPAMDLILRADYMGWKYAYSPQLFTGERMTLCPCYYTAIQYLDPESSLNAFRDSKGNENAYNKSVCRLHDAIRHYRILSSDAGENAQLKSTVENDASQITIPELKAYFYKAIERKKRETEKGKE